jgi:hypothetical protein
MKKGKMRRHRRALLVGAHLSRGSKILNLIFLKHSMIPITNAMKGIVSMVARYFKVKMTFYLQEARPASHSTMR